MSWKRIERARVGTRSSYAKRRPTQPPGQAIWEKNSKIFRQPALAPLKTGVSIWAIYHFRHFYPGRYDEKYPPQSVLEMRRASVVAGVDSRSSSAATLLLRRLLLLGGGTRRTSPTGA